jgi:putative ABC transport system permease protein
MMSRLLLVSTLRHIQRNPWQTWLSIIGIAIGVAVIVAVELANQSASQAFLLSAQSITGRATHQITGGRNGIPEGLYAELRNTHGLRQSAPVVHGIIKKDAESLQLIGVDPFAEQAFRQLDAGLDRDTAVHLLTVPDTVLLSRITAERYSILAGDSMLVTIGGQEKTLQVAGLLEGDNPAALEGLLLCDIATAQELLGRSGRLDRIDLILESDQVTQLQSLLPAGLHLEVPESRNRVMQEMIAAFQTNLTAMSLLAMLVGAFLIYNTMTFSVLRRRRMMAMLRIVGVTRRSLFVILQLEAGLLGIIGTVAGLILGTATAHFLVQLVTRTINDLYFVLTVTQLIIEPSILIKGAAIGLGITLLATVIPAVEAGRIQPVDALRRSQLERRVHRALPWLVFAGLIILIAGLILVDQKQAGLTGGFVALFMIIIGFSLLIPVIVVLLSRLGHHYARSHGLLLRYAARSLDANLSRTGLSIAALSIAVAATLGVSIMISSFRTTVSDWLDYTLRSDFYVSALSDEASYAISDKLQHVRSVIDMMEQVAETSSSQRVTVDTQYGPVDLLAIEMATRSQKGFRFVSPPQADIWTLYRQGKVVLISEPFAYRQQLNTGDQLEISSPDGPITLPIAGVFYDYGSERGLISMDRLAYASRWNDPGISTIGVFLKPGTETGEVINALRVTLSDQQAGLRMRSTREIREHSMQVFDRTFAITQVLRILAIGVAFIGI